MASGLTQEQLARALGLTFQQVQKYERGINRVVASRLFELAGVLKVPVAYFFEGLDDFIDGTSLSLSEPETLPDQYGEKETLSLVRAFHGIADTTIRRRIIDLIRALSRE